MQIRRREIRAEWNLKGAPSSSTRTWPMRPGASAWVVIALLLATGVDLF